jgi:chromosome partitioning protein
MILAIVNTKGGVTKTTSSMHVAVALSKFGRTAVLDADPQGSASDWAIDVEEGGRLLPFDVKVVNQRTLTREANAYDHAVIDTPPGDPRTIDAAIAAADIVLVPTQASELDIKRVWPTLDAASAAGKPVAVLLVKTRQNTLALAAAVEAFEASEIAVLETQIPLREAIQNSYGTIPTELFGYDQVAADLLEVHSGYFIES